MPAPKNARNSPRGKRPEFQALTSQFLLLNESIAIFCIRSFVLAINIYLHFNGMNNLLKVLVTTMLLFSSLNLFIHQSKD